MRDLRDIFGMRAYKIAEKHWQSGFPRPFRDLPRHGVDVIVMASAEVQPDINAQAEIKGTCPDLTVILCPYEDTDDVSKLPAIVKIADKVSDRVVDHLKAGRRVLVTCSAGRNRSGLISGLVLVKKFKMTGTDAVRQIKRARWDALTNDAFRNYLESIK